MIINWGILGYLACIGIAVVIISWWHRGNLAYLLRRDREVSDDIDTLHARIAAIEDAWGIEPPDTMPIVGRHRKDDE